LEAEWITARGPGLPRVQVGALDRAEALGENPLAQIVDGHQLPGPAEQHRHIAHGMDQIESPQPERQEALRGQDFRRGSGGGEGADAQAGTQIGEAGRGPAAGEQGDLQAWIELEHARQEHARVEADTGHPLGKADGVDGHPQGVTRYHRRREQGNMVKAAAPTAMRI
jgi:hypothetical protein